MIEDAGVLEAIDAILALDTVNGVFVGPSDLSLRRQRGAYSRTGADFADLRTIALGTAALVAGLGAALSETTAIAENLPVDAHS